MTQNRTAKKPTPVATNGKIPREQQLAVLSSTLHRLDAARSHGLQYGGERDLCETYGYPKTLSYSDFFDLYDRDPLAGRIIDMISEDTWGAPPEIKETRPKPKPGEATTKPEDEEATAFETAWQDFAKRLGVWAKFERADRLTRIGRYGVLVIGAGVGDDANLERPITKLDAKGILFLTPYPEPHARIERNGLNQDPGSPRFMLPEFYTIDLSSDLPAGLSREQNTRKVHWTRVLHIVEGALSDELHGRPALRRIFNALHDLAKVTGSTAEAYWQRVAGLLIASIDPTMVGVNDDMLETLDEDLKAVFHDLRRFVIGQGIDLKRLAESEPNPAEAAKLLFTLIAAGEGIPFRRLLGNETGERASSEDEKAYLGRIAKRQKTHAEQMFVRALIDRMMQWGALPTVKEYEVAWPPLFEESDLTISEANRNTAAAVQSVTPPGADQTLLYEVDEDRRLRFKPRKADDPSPFEEMLEEQKEMEREAMEKALQPEPGAPATKEAA